MSKPTTCQQCQYHTCDMRPGGSFYCDHKQGRKLPDFSAFNGPDLKPPEEMYPAPGWCPLTDEAQKGVPNPFSNAIP